MWLLIFISHSIPLKSICNRLRKLKKKKKRTKYPAKETTRFAGWVPFSHKVKYETVIFRLWISRFKILNPDLAYNGFNDAFWSSFLLYMLSQIWNLILERERYHFFFNLVNTSDKMVNRCQFKAGYFGNSSNLKRYLLSSWNLIIGTLADITFRRLTNT